MRLLARFLMRTLIEISVLLLMEGSMRLLTCLLVGLFDVSSALITLGPTILDLIFSYTLLKKIDLPLKIDSLNYLFLLEI